MELLLGRVPLRSTDAFTPSQHLAGMRLKQISVSLECILDEFTQFFFKLEKLSYLPMTQSINGIKIQSNKWCKLHLKNRNEPTSSVFYLL